MAAVEKKSAEREDRNRQVLTSGRFGTFWEVAERQQFYLWFYEQTLLKKHHVRWPLAAAVVAYQALLGSEAEIAVQMGVSSQAVQAMLRRGNQVIFDDVLPKLGELWTRTTPLQNQAAIDWDGTLLSEEQNLIQPLYAEVSAADRILVANLAAQRGVMVTIGAWEKSDNIEKDVLTGPGRRAKTPVPFTGDILSVSDRWRFGMSLGQDVSTLDVKGTIPANPPSPRPEYLNGAALATIDVRPRLHQFEALTDTSLGEVSLNAQVSNLMRTFSAAEQKTFLTEPRFKQRAAAQGLPWVDMRRGVVSFKVDLVAQLELLDTYAGANWQFATTYNDIRPMILEAPADQRKMVRGARWRGVFKDVCDDATIVTAVDDLLMVNPERQDWINAEQG
jgi:hypothetical protein